MHKLLLLTLLMSTIFCEREMYCSYINQLMRKDEVKKQFSWFFTEKKRRLHLSDDFPVMLFFYLAIDRDLRSREFITTIEDYFPTEIATELFSKLSKDKEEYIRYRIAQHPETPIKILLEMKDDVSNIVKAINPTTSPTILNQLIGIKNRIIHESLAKNPSTPKSILKKVKFKNNHSISLALASNLNCPKDCISRLLESKNEQIKYEVLRNQKISTGTITEILNGNDEMAMFHLALNPHMTGNILKDLNNKNNITMYPKKGIILNPSTPIDVLEKLLHSSNRFIRTFALGSPNIQKVSRVVLEKLVKQEWAQSGLASNENTPIEILRLLYKLKEKHIDYRLAMNGSLPSEMLENLASRSSSRIKQVIAFNKSTSKNLLKIMSDDSSIEVKIRAKLRLHLLEKHK